MPGLTHSQKALVIAERLADYDRDTNLKLQDKLVARWRERFPLAAQEARRINDATSEEVARAMESLPTAALEWAVRFEALAHAAKEEPLRIEETLAVEIRDIGEDYPGQADDYRLEQLRLVLVRFVRHVADTYSKSPAESELIVLAVAKDAIMALNASAVERLYRRIQEGRISR